MFSKTPAQSYQAVLDRGLSLPSSLEDNKLVTISVAHNGSYKDDHDEEQHLANVIIRVIEMMTRGQKVLIQQEEKEEENDEGEKEEEKDEEQAEEDIDGGDREEENHAEEREKGGKI